MTLLPESMAMVELGARYVEGKWVWGGHAAALVRLAGALNAHKGELAGLAAAEVGSPRSWSTFGQVITAVGVLRAYAAITPHYPFASRGASMPRGPGRDR